MGDAHRDVIENNRLGILKGAVAKEQQGVIDQRLRILIETFVAKAPLSDFRPLLFVIPFPRVRDRVRTSGDRSSGAGEFRRGYH